MANSAHYIKNAAGGIQIVSDEHYKTHLLTSVDEAGIAHLKTGYTELKPAEAKKAKPQLFGGRDPQVRYNQKELVQKNAYERELREYETPATPEVPTLETAAETKAKK
jgi:hypothetical protein